MKKIILIIGGIVTVVLAILWYLKVVSEPIVSIGVGLLTVIGYILIPEERNNTTNIKQQNTGHGDNVLGDKTITNNYTIVKQEKELEKGNSRISKFSAIEIRDAINDSPVFQKDEIAKNYYGIRIKWRVKLYAMHPRAGSIVDLMTEYEGGYPWVHFDVDLNNYPTLKVAKEGKEYLVTGLILKYNSNSFYIDLENLEEL